MHRAAYRAPPGIGVEVMTVLALAGPCAEEVYCGKIDDGSDWVDVQMAREYLGRKYNALQIGFQLNRHRDAADALIRSAWARARIYAIANSLLRCGSLTGEQIAALA
jgi:hypothetical protein